MPERTENRDIELAVKEKAPEGRLPCEEALALARKLNIRPIEVGKACNILGIKIVACQLGCFR